MVLDGTPLSDGGGQGHRNILVGEPGTHTLFHIVKSRSLPLSTPSASDATALRPRSLCDLFIRTDQVGTPHTARSFDHEPDQALRRRAVRRLERQSRPGGRCATCPLPPSPHPSPRLAPARAPVHLSALHCTALHCTALHCTALHAHSRTARTLTHARTHARTLARTHTFSPIPSLDRMPSLHAHLYPLQRRPSSGRIPAGRFDL